MSRPLIAYLRVAPRERVDERPDLTEQRAVIEQRAAENGWEIVRAVQDVRSGRSTRRPGLREAQAACRAGEAEGIVVAQLDRLTYRLADLAELAAEAMRDGYAVVALDLGLDLAEPDGRLVAEVLATAAEWTPSALGEPRRRLGRAPGRPSSTPPAVAERIRSLRDEGMTLQAICDRLNAERVPTPRGGSHWRPTSLRSILATEPVDSELA